jgi:glycerophosphoryl diester phosphodiesterase
MPFATPSFIEQAHALGLVVHAWTVNDQAIMNRLLDAGVDGIMTDDLDALRNVMTERGLWQPSVSCSDR